MASTIWKGHVTFGLVSFPVKLFAAARSESISFNQLHKHDNSRVKQVIFCKAEDRPIPKDEIVKGYEYAKDQYVIVEQDEIDKIVPPSAKVMEILEFVKAGEIDPIYYESSYYIAPDAGGEKPYTLLYKTMLKSGYAGVAKITMHQREHIVIFRATDQGITMHTMFYADEVRQVEGFRADAAVSDQETKLAEMLVESLATSFEPKKYHDTFRVNLNELVSAKIAGKQVVTPPYAEPAKTVDIMEALKESIKAAASKKKPAEQPEPAPATEKTAKAKKAATR